MLSTLILSNHDLDCVWQVELLDYLLEDKSLYTPIVGLTFYFVLCLIFLFSPAIVFDNMINFITLNSNPEMWNLYYWGKMSFFVFCPHFVPGEHICSELFIYSFIYLLYSLYISVKCPLLPFFPILPLQIPFLSLIPLLLLLGITPPWDNYSQQN